MLSIGILNSGHLPVIFAMIFVVNLGGTYIVAVGRDDVDPLLPYVSTDGDRQPESCIFGLLLNISTFLIFLIIKLRYELVEKLVRGANITISRLNLFSYFTGLLGSCGMLVVANFQETALVRVHLYAAFVAFAGGCVYMCIQAYITVIMCPVYVGARIGYMRSLIAFLSFACLVFAIFFGFVASNTFHSVYPDLPTPRPWTRRIWQPASSFLNNTFLLGYEYHVYSAIAEWTMAAMHILFILSYSRDFEKIHAKMVVENLVDHMDHSPMTHSIDEGYAE